MRISKSWLNDWIDISAKSANELCFALNEIGLEVDSCESLSVSKGVVVAKVLECKMHENSDHLHVCKVDCGSYGIFQIVCGAPNVAQNQFVACALIGAKIGDITIKKATLRGVESNGMLCSARELGLGEINNGIMILDDSIGKLELGKELSEYEIFNDYIIEIELTPNRGDCLSVRGIARDLAAKFDLDIKEFEQNIKKPDDDAIGIGRLFSLHNDENKNSSLLYKAVNLSKNFSLNLKELLRLNQAQIKIKNALQGALEYTTHSTGVIFFAYDAKKIYTNENEKFSLKAVSKNNEETRIYADDKLLSIVGIWQNKEFMADENTNIAIIESSYTNPQIITKTIGQDKNLPRDEITYRSTRGSEPTLSIGMNLLCCEFFAKEQIYGGNQQINSIIKQEHILINYSHINKMIGMDINKKDIHKILNNLNFEISNQSDDKFYVKAPIYRHDIQNIQDVCEEIVRIQGIDNIISAPMQFSENNRLTKTYLKHKNASILRQKAVGSGYFECVHYIFDDINELKILGFKECELKIVNPITNELSELKPTLLNSLLNSAINNAKNGKKQIKLFEYGEVFNQKGEQSSKIAFVQSGLNNEPSLLNGAKAILVDFFSFANDLQKILGKIELKKSDEISFLSPFEQAKILQNGKIIGFLGRVKPNIKQDLPKTYVCELDFDKIEFTTKIAKPYSIYQAISRDLSLLINERVSYEKIKKCIEDLKICELKNFYPVDKYSDEKLGKNTSLTINFTFQSNDKTFVDDEINEFMDKIITALKNNIGLDLR